MTLEQNSNKSTSVLFAALILACAVFLWRIYHDTQVSVIPVSGFIVTAGLALVTHRSKSLRSLEAGVKGFTAKFGKLEGDVSHQKEVLDSVSMLVKCVINEAELAHLENLESGTASNFLVCDSVKHQLRHLRDSELITVNYTGNDGANSDSIGGLRDGKEKQLGDFAKLTDLGREYLANRRKLEALTAKPQA